MPIHTPLISKGQQLFDYSSHNKPLAAGDGPLTGDGPLYGTVWDHLPLHSFAAQPLSPFSYSMIAEILRRGWFNYYSRLGFDPQHSAKLCRQYQGLPYLNLTISAELEAEKAGIDPLTLRIDEEPRTVATAKKQGIFAGLTSGRSQRKINSVLRELHDETDAITQKTRDWYLKTQELKWSQAEILQVMEEIERFGTDSLMVFFAARHNIELLQNRLLWALQEQAPFPKNLTLAHMPAQEIEGSIEQDISQRIAALRTRTGDEFDQGLAELVEAYGHRGFSEGELSLPRWDEDQTALISAIQSETFCTNQNTSDHKETLLDAIAPQQQKESQQWLEQLASLYRLESDARNAFSYIQAGTRTWSKAAAQEAMADNRILNAQDVYLFELEQVKEMMTGEWNVSSAAEIQAEADRRRTEIAAWTKSTAATLLIDDTEMAATLSATAPATMPTVASHFWLGE